MSINEIQKEYTVWQALAQKYHGIPSKAEDYKDIQVLLNELRKLAIAKGYILN